MKFVSLKKSSKIFRNIFQKNELKKIIPNLGWLIGENVVRLFLGLVVGIWMARYLGPGKYGLFNYALAYVALFSSLVTLGLDNIVIREIVKDKSKTNKILGSAFFLKVIAGVVTFFLVTISVFFFKGNDLRTKTLIIIFAGGLIFYAFDTIGLWFQSKIESKYIVYAKLGAFILTSLLRIILLLVGAQLIYFIWLALAEIIIGAVGLIIVYKANNQKFSAWKFDLPIAKKLISSSWPLIFSGIAITVYMKIDQVMIGNIVGTEAVGIYSVAVRLSEVWYFIPTIIAVSVFPAIITLRQNNLKLYLKRLQIFYDLMIWLSIFITVPIALFSKEIISMIFGSQYIGAAPVLSVYIWTSIAIFIGVASEQYLLAENLVKVSFIRTTLGGLSNVLLNWYLIPKYGIVGSAWATLISYNISVFSIIFIPQTKENFSMMVKTLNIFRIIKNNVKLIGIR